MEKILIVEDDAYTGQNLENELKRKGYECTWAKTKDDAVRNLEANKYSLVITDGYYPAYSGGEAKLHGNEICELAKDKNIETIVLGYSSGPRSFKSQFNQIYHKLEQGPEAIAEATSLYLNLDNAKEGKTVVLMHGDTLRELNDQLNYNCKNNDVEFKEYSSFLSEIAQNKDIGNYASIFLAGFGEEEPLGMLYEEKLFAEKYLLSCGAYKDNHGVVYEVNNYRTTMDFVRRVIWDQTIDANILMGPKIAYINTLDLLEKFGS